MSQFATLLKRFLKRKKISILELSRLCNFDRGRLNQILNGKRSLNNDEVLKNNDSIIVCVKNWLDKDKVMDKILSNTKYKHKKEILYLNSDVESTYYLLTI